MQKKVFCGLLMVLGIFLLCNFVSAYGYDTDDIINSPYGYDTTDYPSTFDPTYIFAYTNNTITVANPGTWYNVTFDEEEYNVSNGITHNYNNSTNNSFYIIKAGTYEILGTISIIDASVNAENHIMVYRMIKNGVEIHGSIWEGDFARVDAASKRNFNTLVECSIGDSLGLQFTGTDTDISLYARDSTGYGDSHAHSSSIIIKRIA